MTAQPERRAVLPCGMTTICVNDVACPLRDGSCVIFQAQQGLAHELVIRLGQKLFKKRGTHVTVAKGEGTAVTGKETPVAPEAIIPPAAGLLLALGKITFRIFPFDEEQPDVPLGVPSFHDRIHRCGIGPPGSTICPAAPH